MKGRNKMERKVLFNYLNSFTDIENDMIEQRKEEDTSELLTIQKELKDSNLSDNAKSYLVSLVAEKKTDIENYEEDSGLIHDLVWEYFNEDLEFWFSSEWFNKPIKVSGTLGFWNGRKEIEPKYYDNLKDAIEKMIIGYDNFVLEQEGDKYILSLIHHDSRHILTLELVDSIPQEEEE
jgi:hypothetical protein